MAMSDREMAVWIIGLGTGRELLQLQGEACFERYLTNILQDHPEFGAEIEAARADLVEWLKADNQAMAEQIFRRSRN